MSHKEHPSSDGQDPANLDHGREGGPTPVPEPSPEFDGGTENDSGKAKGSGLGPRSGSKRSDRDLIHDALEQILPRTTGSSLGPELILEQTFPGYEILREIHRGGQGVVYQALQRATKRKVAIKVIHGGPFTGSSGKARFEREVQILGQLNHPHIVGIHDSGQTSDGSFYYVMDYIAGKSLDEVLKDSTKLPIDDTLELFIKICDAVNAAHLKGVIHRDLKPANVRINTNGEPVVVDFGLAKIAVHDYSQPDQEAALMTITGQFIGSLPWASPEQAEGTPGAIDVRTDVYSLGVMLYQMLTGKFPYQVIGNMRDVLDNILRAQPAPPSTVRRQINNEVETIVLKCLSKSRDRRYQTAGELAKDLRHYLNGEPIEAKRDSGFYVITKTLSRHKFTVGTAVLFLVLLIGSTIAMWVLYQKATQQQRIAEVSRVAAEEARSLEFIERQRADENARTVFDFATKTTFAAADQIAQVQGSTPALLSLVKGSVERLEKIQPQITKDAAMMRILGGAFNRLSEYQSDLVSGREGDAAQARATHERALAIRTDLAASSPNEWQAQADLAQSLYRGAMLTQGQRDYAGAAVQFDAALAQYEKALALASMAPTTQGAELSAVQRARMLTLRMRCYLSLRMAEDTPRESLEGLTQSNAKIAEALALYATLEPQFETMIAQNSPNTEPVRQRAAVWDERAKCLNLLAENQKREGELKAVAGDKPGSLVHYTAALATLDQAATLSRKSAAEFVRLRTADPKGADRDADLFVSTHALGETVMTRAEVKDSAVSIGGHSQFADSMRKDEQEALELFEKALSHANASRVADPTRIKFTRNLAVALLKVGRQQAALGMLDDAIKSCNASVDLRREILRYDSVVRHKRDLGAGLLKVAEVSRKLALASQESSSVAIALAKSETSISEARTHFEHMRDAGIITPTSVEMRFALREQANVWLAMAQVAFADGDLEQATSLVNQAKGNLLVVGDPPAAREDEATLGKLDNLLKGPR